MRREIHGTEVIGVEIDGETRCAHYHSKRDIIAIKFKCCGNWFPCHQCHAELADHRAIVWPKSEFDLPAILCGGCGYRLTIRDYLQGNSSCPRCKSAFNPGCAHHHHLYFENVHCDA